jgi:hypothetical protein
MFSRAAQSCLIAETGPPLSTLTYVGILTPVPGRIKQRVFTGANLSVIRGDRVAKSFPKELRTCQVWSYNIALCETMSDDAPKASVQGGLRQGVERLLYVRRG